MSLRTFLVIVAGVLLVSTQSLAAQGDAILGVWTTQEKEARIEIYACGPWYCGKISWLKEPNYPQDDNRGMRGLPVVDRDNPDPGLRNRPLLGLRLMEGFSYEGPNQWKDGRIYNPENGKFYKAKIKLVSPNRLKLRGFIGISLFGQTETWTRWQKASINPN